MRVFGCEHYADANQMAIAAAGAVQPLIALLASPSIEVQLPAAGAVTLL